MATKTQKTAHARVSRVRAHGEAGRRGAGVRSDLWVEIEVRDRGGIELELSSRVEPYYGDSIREQVGSLLETLGLPDAGVTIEDTGALPFVIAARVAAAARRTGVELRGDGRPEVTVPATSPAARDRLRRSRLYLPGNEPKFMLNAALFRPDGIILDLEDSVHPDAKDDARLLVRNALCCVDFAAAERMVRINQLPPGLKDLEAVVPERPDMILIPKVESAEQVREVDDAIGELSPGGASSGPPWLMPILESAVGIEHAFEIARSSRRVAALTIGLEDYAADLGVPRSADGIESTYARSRIVNAAKAAGVQAIDSVYSQVDDLDGLSSWAQRSRRLGFEGMGCLHPRQIGPIHQIYNPQPEEIDKAQRVVEAYEKAQAEGLGVVSLGSKMIDPPVVKQALRLVERARELGLLGRGADGNE